MDPITSLRDYQILPKTGMNPFAKAATTEAERGKYQVKERGGGGGGRKEKVVVLLLPGASTSPHQPSHHHPSTILLLLLPSGPYNHAW